MKSLRMRASSMEMRVKLLSTVELWMLLKLKMINGFTLISSTLCISHGKVCDVIIDGKSYKNMVSKIMMEKLWLKVKEQHPHSYKLSWLQMKNVIKVNKKCLVDFLLESITKFKFGMTLFPWMHVTCCFSRPWQYNRRVIYDGYKNTFFF